MVTSPQRLDLREVVDELTRPHKNREYYTGETGQWLAAGTATERFVVATSWTTSHETTAPSLVHQLLYASPSRGESVSATFTSRPTGHIEAVDMLVAIDSEAAAWVRRLGHDDPGDSYNEHRQRVHGSGTIACIRLLHGLQASQHKCKRPSPKRDENTGHWCCTRHNIETDIRRWRTQARIISGWDQAAWKPNNTCPICDHRGSLRVRIDQTALCIECHETWDDTTIGLLAEHIRAENGEAA